MRKRNIRVSKSSSIFRLFVLNEYASVLVPLMFQPQPTFCERTKTVRTPGEQSDRRRRQNYVFFFLLPSTPREDDPIDCYAQACATTTDRRKDKEATQKAAANPPHDAHQVSDEIGKPRFPPRIYCVMCILTRVKKETPRNRRQQCEERETEK